MAQAPLGIKLTNYHDLELKLAQLSGPETASPTMPPRMRELARAAAASLTQSPLPVAPFLVPFLHQQRSASILGSLSDVPSSYKRRKRVGRGPASGKGKTSGRGHKGQGQHGGVPWHLRDPERRRELQEGQEHRGNP